MIETDLKMKLEDGFKDLKSDIKSLKKSHQQQNDQMKRFKMIT